jgi:colanic acid biosynthesis glycosyl transferase WcaI
MRLSILARAARRSSRCDAETLATNAAAASTAPPSAGAAGRRSRRKRSVLATSSAAAPVPPLAKMKILICGLNFSPECLGIGKYTGELASTLADQGHAVQVVTAPPYYPQWAIAEGYRGSKYSGEQQPNLRIIRCPLWVPRKPTVLRRIVHLMSFALSSIPAMLWAARSRPDVVLVIEPSVFCLPVAWLTARVCGASAWLHVQDFEIDAAFELGILKRRSLRIIAQTFESQLMRRFDRVSSISPKMTARLMEKGVDSQRVRLFPNWVDCRKLFPLQDSAPLKASFGIDPRKLNRPAARSMAGCPPRTPARP